MIFTTGAILLLIGSLLYGYGRDHLGDTADACEAWGALMALAGAVGVVVSLAILAWRHLP